jgi:hypothetical protein
MTGGCQARGEVDEVEVGLGVEQMLQKEKSNETHAYVLRVLERAV